MIPSSTNKDIYNGNGSTSIFAYTFPIHDDDEIKVQTYNTSTGAVIVLVKTTDYTVSGVGDINGGNITLVDAATDAPSGVKVVLSRNPGFLQETEYTEYDTFPASSHELALDHIVMLCQYLQEIIDRTLKLQIGLSNFSSEIKGVPTSGAIPTVNSDADGFVFASLASVGSYVFPGGSGFLYQTSSGFSAIGTFAGTANEITITGTSNLVLSLPATLTFTGKTITGGTYTSPTLSGTTTFSSTPIIAGNPTFSGTPQFGSFSWTGTFTSSGGTLAGTVAGTPTFSGNVVFSATPTFVNAGVTGTITGSGSAALSGSWAGTPTWTGKHTYSAAIDEAKGSDIASAGTTDIGAATGNYVKVTGTTTITSFGTVQAGVRRLVTFTGALTLTHNATSLILPNNGANITTAAGDSLLAVSEGSGNWRVPIYQRSDGTPLVSGASEVVQCVHTQTGATASGATTTPLDDTIPQNTEGNEFMTLAITPSNSLNILEIKICAVMGSTAAVHVVGALHQDSAADALAAATSRASAANDLVALNFSHYMVAGTTSSTTFKFRAGGAAASTIRLNGTSGARLLGGVSASSMTILEYLP